MVDTCAAAISPLFDRRILVIGTGAISVCHLPLLVGALRASHSADVVVALTAAAGRLVSAEALSVLTGQPVIPPNWPATPTSGAEHVRIAESVDLIVVWPATLEFLARCAYGLANDLPAATVLAARVPVIFAPSLAEGVSSRAPFKRAVDMLREDGHHVLPTRRTVNVTSRKLSDGGCIPIDELLVEAAAVLGRFREQPRDPSESSSSDNNAHPAMTTQGGRP